MLLLQELICFGVSISNANISELRDLPGDDNKYFESLKRHVSPQKLACCRSSDAVSECVPQGWTLKTAGLPCAGRQSLLPPTMPGGFVVPCWLASPPAALACMQDAVACKTGFLLDGCCRAWGAHQTALSVVPDPSSLNCTAGWRSPRT